MRILSIETSCDETAVALLEIAGPLEKPEVKVLANSLLSQIHLHAEYGGVYPNLAKREHEKNLPILLEKTLKEAGENLDKPYIDYIAVTEGPGLEPALWTGIVFAQELGKKWSASGRKVPVVGVNHMAGHIYSVLYNLDKPLALPALALLVSGGHTELVYIKDFEDYEILGRTKDDAVGEAFDKVARMLGLPYPGGPKISVLAGIHRKKAVEPTFELPRPMLHSKNLDFSYSGLKTAVLYKIKDRELTEDEKEEIARAFEDAAIDVLIAKTKEALTQHPEIQTLICGGGVAANLHLQTSLHALSEEFPDVALLMPARELTTDNAIMIGIASYIRVKTYPQALKVRTQIVADGNLALTSSQTS